MLSAWRYLWKFMPPAAGFAEAAPGQRRLVSRRCLKWARVVTRYKQIVVPDEQEGLITKRIPVEWGMRCLQWAPELVKPPRRPGTRIPVEIRPPQPPKPFPAYRYARTRYIFREPLEDLGYKDWKPLAILALAGSGAFLLLLRKVGAPQKPVQTIGIAPCEDPSDVRIFDPATEDAVYLYVRFERKEAYSDAIAQQIANDFVSIGSLLPVISPILRVAGPASVEMRPDMVSSFFVIGAAYPKEHATFARPGSGVELDGVQRDALLSVLFKASPTFKRIANITKVAYLKPATPITPCIAVFNAAIHRKMVLRVAMTIDIGGVEKLVQSTEKTARDIKEAILPLLQSMNTVLGSEAPWLYGNPRISVVDKSGYQVIVEYGLIVPKSVTAADITTSKLGVFLRNYINSKSSDLRKRIKAFAVQRANG